MFRCYDDLTRAVMIRNRWQPSSYISFILTVSPASFNFCLIGQPNDEKKKEDCASRQLPYKKKKKKKYWELPIVAAYK